MALLTVQRSPSVDGSLDSDDEEAGEAGDSLESLKPSPQKTPKLGRLRAPSFEGYFASKSGAVALADRNVEREANTEQYGELQVHLQRMVSILRENDLLRMAVRIESVQSTKKRYLTLVTSEAEESIILGIDWTDKPTIGLVLPIYNSTQVKLDGDGGFHVSSHSAKKKMKVFKPVSVQTLWSAMQMIQKATDLARNNNYFLGGPSHAFVDHYTAEISSDPLSISEWNMMDDIESTKQIEIILSEQEEDEQAYIKRLIRMKLKEVMMKVDLDEVNCKQIRMMCEEEVGMDLSEYKKYIDTEMLVILGQMDSASEIFPFLYLGSEWNASNLEELKNIGIGYILNLARELDNFFAGSFIYYNVREYDVEETDLLQYWEHTYRFINQAKEAGSKCLVHCRMGISRSASTIKPSIRYCKAKLNALVGDSTPVVKLENEIEKEKYEEISKNFKQMVIAYAMKAKGWSLTETMEFVRNRRSIIQPNKGFQKQLIIYEGILNSSRNRYNAIFRQRSKSDNEQNLRQEKRRRVKLQRSIAEEHGDDVDNQKIKQDNEENIEPNEKDAKRPKSSSSTELGEPENDSEKRLSEAKNGLEPPGAEGQGLTSSSSSDGDQDMETFETDQPTPESKPEEDDIAETEPADEPEEKNEVGSSRRHRPFIRSQTLPSCAFRKWRLKKEEEKKEKMRRQSSDAKIDEAKEDEIIEKARIASQMKRNLLRSLERLHETRGTKKEMDKQSVESIIKPSSLRKLSMSRRLPLERRHSISEEETDVTFETRKRRSQSFAGIEHDSLPVIENNVSKSSSLPGRRSTGSMEQRSGSKKEKVTFLDEVAKPAENTDCEGRDDIHYKVDNEKRDCDSALTSALKPQVDSEKVNSEEKPTKVNSRRSSSRRRTFLHRSITNVREDHRRRTLNEKDLRIGAVIQSYDIISSGHIKETEAKKVRDELVVKTSQFDSVKEAARQIEKLVKESRSRIVRSPRRRTVGESEIRRERNQEEGIDKRPKSTMRNSGDYSASNIKVVNSDAEMKPAPADSTPKSESVEKLPIVGSLETDVDDPSLLPSPGRVLRKKESYEGMGSTQKTPSEIEMEDQKIITDRPKSLAAGGDAPQKEPLGIDTENSDPEADVSVKDLVKYHVEKIQRSSPPATQTKAPPAIFDSSESAKQALPDSVQEAKVTVDADIRSMSISNIDGKPMETEGKEKDESEQDLASPGLVKRHSELFEAGVVSDVPALNITDDSSKLETPNCPETDISSTDGDGILPDDASLVGISRKEGKRRSVKDRLREWEEQEKASQEPNRKAKSSSSQESEKDLDNEVANMARPIKRATTLPKSRPKLMHHMTLPETDNIPSKSAPTSPDSSRKPETTERRLGRASSFGEVIRRSDETAGKDIDIGVKSLVSKFEA